MSDQASEHVDVLIIGAGLAGIGAAVHLQKGCPEKSYAILESRESIGGTWDLFRYPGIRSDSDMFTLGYSFKPWLGEKSIADGESILGYIKETAEEYGVEDKIRFGHKVVSADWSSADARWTIRAERDGEPVELTCNWLYGCTGYYRYDEGFLPKFEGTERFEGQIVHPQHWPEDLDYEGKRVVVIGSGATAMTLVPALAGLLQAHPSQTARTAAARRLRHRYPLQAAVRPLGRAPLRRAGRRPVQGDPRRQGRGRHRPDRDLHREGDPAAVGQGAGGRHHRHRHRPQHARPRGDADPHRRQGEANVGDRRLQGDDVQRHPQHVPGARLHQCLLHPQDRPRRRLHLP